MAKQSKPVGQRAAGEPSGKRYHGPSKWFVPFLEARYTRIERKPASAAEQEALERQHEQLLTTALAEHAQPPAAEHGYRSRLQPGRGHEVLAELPPTHWKELLEQYRARQHAVRRGAAPVVPGAADWMPLGPSVLRRGQPTGRPAISGRASGIAIAPNGRRVYVATADGGVWRSDDGGAHWLSTMDSFDLDPTAFAATSLACGAIAIDEMSPNRVYVGTGEGDTNALFAWRLVSALPAYRGVGPLRSDDGGGSWVAEPTASGSPTLVGAAFFQLAVDPGDRENVVAATTAGLYRREPDGHGGYQWVQKRTGIHASVVVARSGTTTTFFAAAWGDKAYSSNDGSSWSAAGTGFPTGTSRIGLAVQRTSASVLYALAADTSGALLGVYRLDGGSGAWKSVSGAPGGLLGNQGTYDLTIAVDPADVDTVFIGGQAVNTGDGAIYRGAVTASGSAYAMATTWVGSGAHPDVHVLAYAPGDSHTLWVCCDGGVFKTTDATGSCRFVAMNTGLATLSVTYLAQHPTEAAVLLCGFQDNGTGSYTGEECWKHILGGDGGYCVINAADPRKVLAYADGTIYRAIDGGQDYGSWASITPAGAHWLVMAEPLVAAPYDPGTPASADVVAFGVGPTLYVSEDFGTTWTTGATAAGGSIYSLTFASTTRIFAGTANGRVYRYDKTSSGWAQTRLDDAAGGALPLTGLIADIAVDPADATHSSIYVAFGGSGDYRHVWHFDGTAWQARSGPAAGAASALLDVEHNAIAIDSTSSSIYVGADIGVWRSDDAGATWTLVESGLPDAAVLDLQLHQPSRRLRAALHGRGVYELALDQLATPDVELHVRDTTLDVALGPTVDFLDDPATWPAAQALHWASPNIKVDVPTPFGWQTPGTDIDFYVFNDKLVDGSGGVATLDPAAGTVTNRVYVEVHNRGVSAAPLVQVMLVIADAFAGPPLLPGGYAANVQAGTPLAGPDWQTVGVKQVTNLRAGAPQVVEFDLPSTLLAPPASLPGHAHFCTLALLHAPADPFAATETNVDLLTIGERKVAQKNLHLVQFTGTPPGRASLSQWIRILLRGDARAKLLELVLDLQRYEGQIALLAPAKALDERWYKQHKPVAGKAVETWAAAQRKALLRFQREGRFDHRRCAQMLRELELVAARPLVLLEPGGLELIKSGPALAGGVAQPLFLRVQPPKGAKPGEAGDFSIALRERDGRRPAGGSTYRVEIVAPAKRPREAR